VNVRICDVAPRDGLQNVEPAQPPAIRAQLVDQLAEAGIAGIECAAFVSSDAVPQMAGAEEVVALMSRRPDVRYAGLVVNLRGYERLAASGLDAVNYVFVTTETFNRRNQRASVAESIEFACEIVGRAQADGRTAGVVIGAAFGCPFEGRVDPGRVLEQARLVAAAGADQVTLADTIGVAVPAQVRRLVAGACELGVDIGVHLHNTRNTGYANAQAALESGAKIFEASVAGVGGCPFAPGATGNIATEDLVYMLEGEGVQTGIDLDKLIATAEWLSGVLERELPGQLHRAGVFPHA
jgi:isopropylmalate/homocitrate/citramalate synthase